MIRGMVPIEIELQRIFWRSFLSLCCFCDAIDDLLTLVPGCPPPPLPLFFSALVAV